MYDNAFQYPTPSRKFSFEINDFFFKGKHFPVVYVFFYDSTMIIKEFKIIEKIHYWQKKYENNKLQF